MKIEVTPIGFVKSTRQIPVDDDWDQESVLIELNNVEFDAEALTGLLDFSHVEVIFYMDQVDPTKIENSARHTLNNTGWPKVGIFAQRGTNRTNQIGTTICRVLAVEGQNLHLEGLDAVNGTPVLDIKPWVHEFGPRGRLFQPGWITELMKGYWKLT